MKEDNKKGDDKHPNTRREFLNNGVKALIGAGVAGAGIGKAYAMSTPSGSADKLPPDYSTLKYSDNYWNRDAMARIHGDLEFGKEKFGWYKGTVRGVMPGKKNQKLCGFEGFSFTRLVDNGDGTYQKLLREVGYYTDLKTGEVLTEWHNPYTDELITNVVHIANDPFNFVISPFWPKAPSYGGLNSIEAPDIPMILPWKEVGRNQVLLQSNIDLFYPSALQPEKWPRESAGPMSQVTEMFNYVFNKDELADPKMTSVNFSGAWNRLTPWLPWMLMGQSEGHIHYDCLMGCYDNMDMLSPQVKAYAKKHNPKFFSAPTKWEEPSLSSLEHYAREQKPVPVKKS